MTILNEKKAKLPLWLLSVLSSSDLMSNLHAWSSLLTYVRQDSCILPAVNTPYKCMKR